MSSGPLFGRLYSLSLGRPNRAAAVTYGTESADMAPLRLDFEIEKSATESTNKAKVTISNLNAQTRRDLAPGHLLRLRAGYCGLVETLFLGNVSKVTSQKKSADIETTLEAGDGEQAITFGTFNKSYARGVSLAQILGDVAQSLSITTSPNEVALQAGIAVGIPNRVYGNGFVAHGAAKATLTKLLRKEGLEWSIQNGALNIIPIKAHNGKLAEIVSPQTGLLNIPSKNGDLVQFTCLLNPRLIPGGIVQLKTPSQQFDGFYKIRSAKFKGDTHGDEWSVEVQTVALKQAKQTLKAAQGFAYQAAVYDA